MFLIATLVFKYNVLIATFAATVMVVGGIFLGRAVNSHPWVQALEGQGVMVLDIASPGFMQPYVSKVDLPNVFINTNKGRFRSLFNRSIGFYLKSPKEANIKQDGEKLTIEIDKNVYTASNFSFMDRPVFLWNSKTNTLVTKEALNDLETRIMTEHLSLLELQQQQELSKDIHALNRTVMDMFAPNKFLELLKNPWFIFFIVVVAAILILMFIAPNMQGWLGGATKSISNALPTKIITPIK